MRLVLSIALVMTLAGLLSAQQTVPRGRGGTPVAPSGIPAVPLPDKPLDFPTAEGQNIRVVVVARGMSSPWSMVWLPGGDMLITQRTGQLRAGCATACSIPSRLPACRRSWPAVSVADGDHAASPVRHRISSSI